MATTLTKLITDETMREVAGHGSTDYPFGYYYEDIWGFELHCIDWHWHQEVEFVFVEKGTVLSSIGSEKYTLGQGSAIFVNTRVIHKFESQEPAVIPNMVFSPTLLASPESLIFRKYLRPILDSSIECAIFSPDKPGQKEVIDSLLLVFAAQSAEKNCEMETVELLLKLWRTMFQYLSPLLDGQPYSQNSALTRGRLQIMIYYIQNNYQRQITLEDIAQTVSLSKSSALSIFRGNLHTSPVKYLVDYRLKQAARLLVNTESSVASIANDTGFRNTGYFCHKFKELFSMTPNVYRKKHNRL